MEIMLTQNYQSRLEDVIGKVVFKDKQAYELLKAYPDKYAFGIGYMHNGKGDYELLEISLVTKSSLTQ